MFFFNKEDVYLGYSVEDFSKVRSALRREGIKYSVKVIDPSGNWMGAGTSRGTFGSSGMNQNFEKQYVVSVKKKDAEQAMYFVHRALHS